MPAPRIPSVRSLRPRAAPMAAPKPVHETVPSAAWIELVRETWRRWCTYRRLDTVVGLTRYSEPGVHDFRVAAQRLRAALRLANHLAGAGEAPPAQRRVRRKFHAVRRLRDVQVMALGLPPARKRPLVARLRRRLRAEELRICARLKRRRHAGRSTSRDERTAALLRAVLRALVAKARASSDAALTEAMRADLAHVQQRLIERVRHMQADDLTTLHRLRLAVKRARYALEIVAATHGLPRAKAACRTAQGWQDLLGTIRDLQVLTEELASLPARTGRDRAVLRLLAARLARDQTEAIRTLLRQGAQLLRFAHSIQCLPGPVGRSRQRAS